MYYHSHLWNNDSVSDTGTNSSSLKSQTISGTAGRLGIVNPSTGTPTAQTATADFHLGNLTLNYTKEYIWAQVDVGFSSGSSVTMSLNLPLDIKCLLHK